MSAQERGYRTNVLQIPSNETLGVRPSRSAALDPRDSMNEMTSNGPAMESSSTESAEPESGSVAGLETSDVVAGSLPVGESTVISGGVPDAAAASDETSPRPETIGPGSQLGHFELSELVGGGGMGRVFRAVDTRLGRTVALKVISRRQAADVETLLRFHNEARAAARLNHESIAQVYFVGEERGFAFIASEYVEGRNLRDLVLRDGPLPLGEAVSYTLQVAEALGHAAALRVVHRDVKPSNVLVTAAGRAKLIDMGLARMRSDDDSASDLTASGVTMGTFDYIAPEQARDPRVADVRSDIYSLGCTLFYLLTGRPPFPQGTVLQKLLQHQGDEPPDVRAVRPELPEEVSRVMRKMMAKDPRRRYQDPSRLIAALWSLAEQIGLQPMGLGSVSWMVPKRRRISLLYRHLPWAVPVAALAAIVVLLDLLAPSPPDAGRLLLPAIAGARNPAATRRAATETPVVAIAAAARDSQPAASAAVPAVLDPVSASDEPSTPPAELGSAADAVSLTPGGSGGRISAADVASVGLLTSNDIQRQWDRMRDGAVGSGSPDVPSATTQRRRWTVDPGNPSGADFSTLSAALHTVADGDVVELRYNGRIEARPLALANLEVTIEAGQGYRPIVVFEPTEFTSIYPHSMLTLTGTQLTLRGLAVELSVPRAIPADSWTMFEMGRGDRIRLERCWLTIRNALPEEAASQAGYHPDVAFFRFKRTLGDDAVLGNGALRESVALLADRTALGTRPSSPPLPEVRLENCIARGEATLLRLEDTQPIDFAWSNGLFVTTDWLLTAAGAQRRPQSGESLHVRLEALTAVVGAGLFQLNCSPLAPYQLPLDVQCDRSVLGTSDLTPGCLVEQVGTAGVSAAMRQLDWHGRQSLYGPFVSFWRIRTPESAAPVWDMTFDQWQSHWTPAEESGVRLNAIPWSEPPSTDAPLSSRTPADYLLLPYDSDLDVQDAGLQSPQLPPLAEG